MRDTTEPMESEESRAREDAHDLSTITFCAFSVGKSWRDNLHMQTIAWPTPGAQEHDALWALLKQQLEANLLLGLPEDQTIGETTRGSDAFVADLESDDGTNDQTA
jgi:hypothetical protein